MKPSTVEIITTYGTFYYPIVKILKNCDVEYRMDDLQLVRFECDNSIFDRCILSITVIQKIKKIIF